MTRWIGLAVFCGTLSAIAASAGELRIVGALGNSSSLQQPVPYAFYSGLALDSQGRLFLIGLADGVPVCDQDGGLLAILALPQGAGGMVPRGQAVRQGERILFVLNRPDGYKGMLCAIDASGKDPGKLAVTAIAAGDGSWAVSPTLTPDGAAVAGIGDWLKSKTYRVATVDSTGALRDVVKLEMPAGAQSPWRHLVQAEPSGEFGVQHLGGANFSGRFSRDGRRLGDWGGGQLVDGGRYQFGYSGQLLRTDLAGKPAPGECGSVLQELRMAGQMVRTGERYFFAGRGGVCEAKWDGTTFVYHRRIGGIFVEELLDDGRNVAGIAWRAAGNNDVQHPFVFPKALPAAAILPMHGPLHGREAISLARIAPDAWAAVFRDAKGVGFELLREHHERQPVPLMELRDAGQIAWLGGTAVLVADPKRGTIWQIDWRHEPWRTRLACESSWRANLPGVCGLAITPDAVFASTATQVLRLSRDGKQVVWTSPETYQRARRLAATHEQVYVCDEAAGLVDQLDAASGRRLARLDGLKAPHAIAADLNAVYIAENGNGRIVIASSTLWRPEIAVLTRENPNAPIVAAKLPVPPVDGTISVNVYDQRDLTVRQLACAAEGRQPLVWDGRDYLGNFVQPGRYRWHGVKLPKLELKYVGSIGNAGRPPYRTADGLGAWGGVWGNVLDVCPVDASPASDVLVLWAFEEGEGGLVRMSQDGEVRWKQHIQWWTEGQATAVASDGRSAYVVSASAKGAPSTDQRLPFWKKPRRPLLWRVDVQTGAYQWYDTKEPQNSPVFGQYVLGDVATDLAVRDGRLFITSPAQGRVFVVEAASGKLLDEWKHTGVSGIAWDSAGKPLVGIDSKIVELDPASGAALKVRGDVGAPIWDLEAVSDGRLVASTRGPRQQVVVLDSEGRELEALGQRGGRPAHSKFIQTDFFDPAGVCVTPKGKLFVAEDSAPRRFSRWNVPQGSRPALDRDWHGPYYLSGMWGVDDEQPEVFYGDSHGDIVRYRFDYATGQWQVDACWRKVYDADSHGQVVKWMPRILHRHGKTYWASGSAGLFEIRDDAWLPVAAVYGGGVVPDEKAGWRWWDHGHDRLERMGTWSDLNGDGQRQPEEWFVTDRPAYPLKGAGPQQGWNAYWAPDFTLFMHDWSDGEAAGIWSLKPEWRTTPAAGDVPIYHWEKAHHAGVNRTTGIGRGSHGCRTAFAANGATYGFNGAYNDIKAPGVGHGADWRFVQITKYDEATGRMLWHAGERASGFGRPGEIACPVGAAGLIHERLFWTDENSLVHVWDDRHGLYLGTLLEDLMRNPDPSPYTVWVELFNTRVWRHPKTGKVYLGAASDAIHVYEVLGTEAKLHRLDGEFELTAPVLAAARREFERRQQARTAEAASTLRIFKAVRPPTLDGNLEEFAAAPAVQFALKPGAQGTARVLYDAEQLYVAFDVEDSSPWKNSGGDLTTLFKTGDCVDVWLGPTAGKRAVGTGDVRVLIAPVNGRATAVLYEAKIDKDKRDGKDARDKGPVHFRSPSGEVVIDRVSVLAAAKVAVQVSATGYRLEAALPWKSLGLSPAFGPLGFDLDINFSDPAGQRNTARLHWARHGAAIVYDLPSEARFEPDLWGFVVFE